MMRTILLAAGLVALAGPAFAQTAANAVAKLEISGDAPSACLVSGAPTTSGTNAAFVSTTDRSAEVRITELVDPTNGVPRASTISLSLPIICNSGHRVVVRTANGGLARDTGNNRNVQATAGFRELLPYQISAVWSGSTVNGTSQTGPSVNIVSPAGAAGDLSLNIQIPAGGAPLVAGSYSDQLVIELQVAS